MNIIGLAGPSGCGKNTAGDFISDYWIRKTAEVPNQLSFAQPLKDAAVILTGWDESVFHDRLLKEDKLPPYGLSPRRFMQLLGTEFIRNMIDSNFWVNRLEMKLNPATLNIITDVRFDNEAEMIRDNGGVILRISRHEVMPSSTDIHASEMPLPLHVTDRVIINNGDLAGLKSAVEGFLSVFKL